MPKESDIQSQTMNYIRVKGWYCQKIQSGMLPATYKGTDRKIKLADAGTPDIIACINGDFIAIEVKKDEAAIARWWKVRDKYESGEILKRGDKTIVNQWLVSKQINEAGGKYLLVCGVEDFIDNLIELGHV